MPDPVTSPGRTTTVTTVGEGTASGVPDTLRVHASVQHRSSSVSEALAGCASAADAAVTAARAFTEAEHVASRGLNVGQWYGDGDRPNGYYAQHSIEVVCADLDRAGELVDGLAEAVGERLRIDHVELFVAEPRPIRFAAREAAFADARAKADQLAALAGQRVDGVLAVVEGGTGGGPSPLGVARVAAASTAFEPGTASVTGTLTVTWLTSSL